MLSVNKGKFSLENEGSSCQMSGDCNINAMIEEEEVIVVENAEISPAPIHRSEGKESETAEHEIICSHLNLQFHDFDDPRVEKSYEVGQIWALHSEVDGLPHSYARIDKFIPSEGKVVVTVLEPDCMNEEEICWVENNLPMGCGTFRASNSSCSRQRTLFSHRVIRDEGKRLKFFKVFPGKREVWAIYKQWDINRTCNNMKGNVQYKLAEVISDYTKEEGIAVVALVRAEGHENAFRRQLHEGLRLRTTTFKGKELLSFSQNDGR